MYERKYFGNQRWPRRKPTQSLKDEEERLQKDRASRWLAQVEPIPNRSSDYEAFFDGACEGGNPTRKIGCGFVLLENTKIIKEQSWSPDWEGLLTNNIAEYEALLGLLNYLLALRVEDKEITIYGDSQLVMYQLWIDPQLGRRREIQSRKSAYAELALEARVKLKEFSNCRGVWIRREQNTLADALSKKALQHE